jgi:hypothetical protein
MRVLLSLLPYEAVSPARHTRFALRSTVLGLHCEYRCIGRGRATKRYAVFEESDCAAEPGTFVEIARRASVEAFGSDLVAMVVQSRKGFHVYLNLWAGSFGDALLLSSRYKHHLPCACRDDSHIANSIAIWMNMKWERYILRVSPTKHPWDWFRVVYRRKSSDECHESFLAEVERLYRAGEVPVP